MSYIISLLNMGSTAGGSINNPYGVVDVSQLGRNKNSVPYPVRYFLNLVRSADRSFVFYFVLYALSVPISKYYFFCGAAYYVKKQGVSSFILEKR